MILNRKFSALLLICLYTYVNNPFYFAVITPIHKAFYYAVSLIPFFYAIYKGFHREKNISTFSRFFLFYFISIFLVMIFSFSLDFQYFKYFLRLVIGICATLSVFCIWKYSIEYDFIREDFLIVFIKSVAFYVLGTTAFVFIPPLKSFWQSLIVDFGEQDFSDVLEYITRFGFAGFSGFGCAFLVTCAAVITCYLFLNKNISLKQCKVYSIIFIVGSFYYGRIGFVVAVFTFGFFSIYLLFHNKPRLFLFYIFILLLFIFLVFALYFAIPEIQPFIDWLLEPILNYFKNGKIESASTNSLGKMYENFSPSDKTLLLGDGYWLGLDGSGYYGKTDVGFMRNILYGGVFYTLLLYFLIVIFLFFLFFNLKQNKTKGAGFLTFVMFIQFMLFELKGDITFLFLKAYLPFYLYLIYEKRELYFYRSKNL